MLIHMNGRVFDPAIGRFVSADPYVDGADTTQGWNRYAYVKGGPLSATDPSGFMQSPCAFRTCNWNGVDWVSVGAGGPLEEVVITASRWTYQLRSNWEWDTIGSARDLVGRRNELVAHLSDGPAVSASSAGKESGAAEEPQTRNPPCEYGPSTASGAIRAGGYAGAGGEVTSGLDNGNAFVTGRAGFGWGGGIAYNPKGGMPIAPGDRNTGGVIRSVTGKTDVAFGIPFTPISFSAGIEIGVAYSNRDGFAWVSNFDSEYGFPAEKGLHASASFGAQMTVYGKPHDTITSASTCRAHY